MFTVPWRQLKTFSMEMRQKATGKLTSGAKPEDKIVNRELKQVFTNGTIVDGDYLTTDDANHCVSVKVRFPQAYGCMLLTYVLGISGEREWNVFLWHLPLGRIDWRVQID